MTLIVVRPAPRHDNNATVSRRRTCRPSARTLTAKASVMSCHLSAFGPDTDKNTNVGRRHFNLIKNISWRSKCRPDTTSQLKSCRVIMSCCRSPHDARKGVLSCQVSDTFFFFNHPERTTSNRQVGPSRLSAKGGEFDSPPVTREHGSWMRRLLLLPALRTAVPNDVVPGDAKEKLKKHHAGANRIKPPGWSVPPFGEGGEFDSPPVTREYGRWMRRLLLLPALRTAVQGSIF